MILSIFLDIFCVLIFQTGSFASAILKAFSMSAVKVHRSEGGKFSNEFQSGNTDMQISKELLAI